MTIPCEKCGLHFNPDATHWLCPYCKWHNTCCQGAPLPERKDDNDHTN